MCMPTDHHPSRDSIQSSSSSFQYGRPRTSSHPKKYQSQSSNHFSRYAPRFALLTVITAYLGRQANQQDYGEFAGSFSSVWSVTVSAPSVLPGIYQYLLPGIASNSSPHWWLFHFVLFCVIINRCWMTLRHQMNRLQRTITDQAIQSFHSVSEIRSAAPRIFQRCSRSQLNRAKSNDKSQIEIRTLALSNSESFVSKDIIEDMTLADMARVFLYVQQINQKGFDRSRFLRGCRSSATQAMDAIDAAAARSRGTNVALPSKDAHSTSDAMDALLFCAAVRIFAEWRSVRAVPPGCPGYAFGMGLAKRDLIHNVGKLERATHEWLDFHARAGRNSDNNIKFPKTSPTLRQLLKHEIENQLHPKLPVLRDDSAASGLLWTKRQLQYQSSAMENNEQVPIHFPTPKAAFNAAYESIYGKYHGFLVRTVFQNTFEAAPPFPVVLQHMNAPYKEEHQQCEPMETSQEESRYIPQYQESPPAPVDEDEIWVHLPLEEMDGERSIDGGNTFVTDTSDPSHNKDEYYTDAEEQEHTDDHLDVGDRIVQFFTSLFGHCVHGNHTVHKTHNALSSFHHASKNQELNGKKESFHCHNDMPFYLTVIRFLEGGLDELIKELNMNDPSRV